MKSLVLAAVLLFLASAPQAYAEFYQWTDRDGKEFYTNEKEKIPAEYRDRAKPVEVREERVSIGRTPVADDRSATGTVSEHRDKNGRGEGYWRARASKLRRELEILQDEYDAVLKKERDEENRPKKLTARAGKKKSQSSRDKKKARLEKNISWKKRQLEVELPEEARKADAYPGWLRE